MSSQAPKYARVTYVHSPVEKVEEGLELWRTHVLPITKQMPGFQGVLSLIDRETGKCISITMWDSEEHMMGSLNAQYHQEAVKKFANYFQGAHAPENYEVVFAEEISQ